MLENMSKKNKTKNKVEYPRLAGIGVTICRDEKTSFTYVECEELLNCLKKNNLSIKKFSKLFGVATCPYVNGKTAYYPWDVEDVLERMIGKKIVGTQLNFD